MIYFENFVETIGIFWVFKFRVAIVKLIGNIYFFSIRKPNWPKIILFCALKCRTNLKKIDIEIDLNAEYIRIDFFWISRMWKWSKIIFYRVIKRINDPKWFTLECSMSRNRKQFTLKHSSVEKLNCSWSLKCRVDRKLPHTDRK